MLNAEWGRPPLVDAAPSNNSSLESPVVQEELSPAGPSQTVSGEHPGLWARQTALASPASVLAAMTIMISFTCPLLLWQAWGSLTFYMPNLLYWEAAAIHARGGKASSSTPTITLGLHTP